MWEAAASLLLVEAAARAAELLLLVPAAAVAVVARSRSSSRYGEGSAEHHGSRIRVLRALLRPPCRRTRKQSGGGAGSNRGALILPVLLRSFLCGRLSRARAG